jgi:hypothetical protein
MRDSLAVLTVAFVLALLASAANAGVTGSFICTAAAPNGAIYNNQGTVAQPFFLAVSLSPLCTGTPTGTLRIGPPGSSHFFFIADGSSEAFQFAPAPSSALIYSCKSTAGTCGMRVQWSLESTH